MRILYVGDQRFDRPGNGAGMADADLCRALVRRGHDVEVIAVDGPEGVPGLPVRRMRLADAFRHFRSLPACPTIAASQATTALSARPRWITDHGEAGSAYGLPGVLGSVACSDYRADTARAAGLPAVVVHPIEPDAPESPPGPYVVAPGASKAKGGDIVAAVATCLPDVRFLAIRTYGGVVDELVGLPNVKIVDPMPPSDLLASMRAMLLPSRRENWAMAPRLAGMRGRPVVARRLYGIADSTGDGAWYVETEDAASWATALRQALAVGGARGKVPVVDHEIEIEALEAALTGPAGRAA